MRSTMRKSPKRRTLCLISLLLAIPPAGSTLAENSPSLPPADRVEGHKQQEDPLGARASEEIAAAAEVTVYKHRFCFCCVKWIDHLQGAGMQTPIVNSSNDELSVLKGRWRIPSGMQGCHTGVLNGTYVVEGHVPARLIRRFLADPPAGSVGLMVPGMPQGSPGMYDGQEFEPYVVYLLMRDGDYRFYARIEAPEREGRSSVDD